MVIQTRCAIWQHFNNIHFFLFFAATAAPVQYCVVSNRSCEQSCNEMRTVYVCVFERERLQKNGKRWLLYREMYLPVRLCSMEKPTNFAHDECQFVLVNHLSVVGTWSAHQSGFMVSNELRGVVLWYTYFWLLWLNLINCDHICEFEFGFDGSQGAEFHLHL